MNKLRKVTLSFILSLLLITGVMPAGTTYSPVVSVEAAVSKKQTAKFVKAVDGDTAKLSVKGRTYTFRFLAVDTPETVKPNTERYEKGIIYFVFGYGNFCSQCHNSRRNLHHV